MRKTTTNNHQPTTSISLQKGTASAVYKSLLWNETRESGTSTFHGSCRGSRLNFVLRFVVQWYVAYSKLVVMAFAVPYCILFSLYQAWLERERKKKLEYPLTHWSFSVFPSPWILYKGNARKVSHALAPRRASFFSFRIYNRAGGDLLHVFWKNLLMIYAPSSFVPICLGQNIIGLGQWC